MENGSLKEKHVIGLLLLQIACVADVFCCVFFSFMVHKVRDTFAWKLNWGQNKKLWGRGRGEKAMRMTTCNQPLEIYEMPLPVLRNKELAYMWCDMLWSLTSAITQCKTNVTVVPNSLMLSLLNFFFNNCLLLIIKEKKLFFGIGLYYWTQSSTFRSKDWIFLIEVLFE